VLNRIEHARRATRAINSLILSENISADKKKRIFHTATRSIFTLCLGIWKMHYKLKGKLSSTENYFWIRAERNTRQVKLRNEVTWCCGSMLPQHQVNIRK
jgi:hypothetical protein